MKLLDFILILVVRSKVANRTTGRTKYDFKPMRAIEAINFMFEHRPKVVVKIELIRRNGTS